MSSEGISKVKFETLVQTFHKLTSKTTSLNSLLEEIIQSARKLIEGEASSLLLFHESHDYLVFKVATGPKAELLPGLKIPAGEGIAGWVALNQESLIVHDVSNDPRFYSNIEEEIEFKTKSILAVPMIFQGKCLGVIEVINKEYHRYFDDDDRYWLEIFSAQASLALVNAKEWESTQKELTELRQSEPGYQKKPIIFESKTMGKIMDLIRKYASVDSPVMITGESGVGKELVAQAIHDQSYPASQPIIKINCSAIPGELLESEFFGHAKGAFTDAIQDKPGKFQIAGEGTLFLDEIGTLPGDLQAKLLRVIQSKRFSPVGSNQIIELKARIISATNEDMRKMLDEGLFRKDLFYRLNVLPLNVPPLRERPDDIPILATYFLQLSNKKHKKSLKISPKTMEIMLSYRWPGNIRELENSVERAMVLSTQEFLEVESFINESSEEASILNMKSAVNKFKVRHITKVLALCEGNQTKAAEIMGIQRTYLSKLLRETNQNE